MAAIDEIFALVKEQGASDLHLTSGAPPLLRMSGNLKPIEYEPLTSELCRKLLYEMMMPDQIERFEREKDIDFSYEIKGVTRLRCNIFEQRNGISGVFRLIPTTILSLEQLAMPQKLNEFTRYGSGLVLVTGATGSGKSTTLAAMIDFINSGTDRHIITIEDPIEFIHKNKKSLVNQREVGTHAMSFDRALRSALREDPDIVLVGEMRDLETMQLAITAAETGQLVFATLHTQSAAQTVDRIIDVFPKEQQSQIRVMLADSLRGVISQRLVKRCDAPGRLAAVEILTGTTAVANLIREGKTFQLASVIQTGKKDGMQSMDGHLLDFLKRKTISPEEAYAHAVNKAAFRGYLPDEAQKRVATEN